MAVAWRIVKTKHLADCFSGEGARLHGGRWNSIGTPLVYLAQTPSLAALELVVHLDQAQLLQHYVLFRVEIPDEGVVQLASDQLPEGWQADPPAATTQRLGDDWATRGQSLVLAVPSAVVPQELNYLLNPRHPDFGRLRVEGPQPFRFDPRLGRPKGRGT